MTTPPVKYTRIQQLPIRPRVVLAALYITAVAILTAGSWIAADRNFGAGVFLCVFTETSIVFHILRRT